MFHFMSPVKVYLVELTLYFLLIYSSPNAMYYIKIFIISLSNINHF